MSTTSETRCDACREFIKNFEDRVSIVSVWMTSLDLCLPCWSKARVALKQALPHLATKDPHNPNKLDHPHLAEPTAQLRNKDFK